MFSSMVCSHILVRKFVSTAREESIIELDLKERYYGKVSWSLPFYLILDCQVQILYKLF
uniref:Uncharacterized protein n=1 Tax=Arundo donax TaxID=35708 RepID=A0A0A9QBA0_ARUDO